MDKISIVDPKELGRGRRPQAKGVHSKRVRGPDGKRRTVYILDTADTDFREQFETVFQLNVTRARRAQRRQVTAVAAE